ncbi:MAG: DegT/DnrJ/EryC1/StrS family aminotransferase [Alphaproteobacteria bacterium]|nr:DegT/DnrJ/EryC1/StrS family aminotransferase [Alphaproteobacteria bacterium]
MPDTAPVPAPVPFVDIQGQTRRLRERIDARIRRVLDHGQFILGPEVRELEEALADYVGGGHVVTTGSGHDAILIALMAEGIGPGDAVFVPAFTFVSTAEAVAAVGAAPIFVDVDERTFTLDPADLARRVAAVRRAGVWRPRAVMPVDIFGMPADYAAIGAVAEAENLYLLADAAQSFGATFGNRRAGRLAAATATSFFPAKPLGAAGDGGALFTEDAGRAAEFRRLRVHGLDAAGDCLSVGMTGRLDTLQAAILLVKLEAFPDDLERREAAARRYDAALAAHVEVPFRAADRTCAWALYTILSDRREAIRKALADARIPARSYYEKALHLHPAFARFSEGPGSLPVTERLGRRNLSLPMHSELDAATIDRIAAVVAAAVSAGRT